VGRGLITDEVVEVSVLERNRRIAWATLVGLISYYAGQGAANAIQRFGLYAAVAVVIVIVVGWITARRVRRRAEARL